MPAVVGVAGCLLVARVVAGRLRPQRLLRRRGGFRFTNVAGRQDSADAVAARHKVGTGRGVVRRLACKTAGGAAA